MDANKRKTLEDAGVLYPSVVTKADDLVKAFNDGYEKGKADAEAYLLHCGDTDEPFTKADRIRSMTDEELAEFIASGIPKDVCKDRCGGDEGFQCSECILDWLRQECD